MPFGHYTTRSTQSQQSHSTQSQHSQSTVPEPTVPLGSFTTPPCNTIPASHGAVAADTTPGRCCSVVTRFMRDVTTWPCAKARALLGTGSVVKTCSDCLSADGVVWPLVTILRRQAGPGVSSSRRDGCRTPRCCRYCAVTVCCDCAANVTCCDCVL